MFDILNPDTLKDARISAGLTQRKLADLAGVNQSTIWRIENGVLDPGMKSTWRPIVQAMLASKKRSSKKGGNNG